MTEPRAAHEVIRQRVKELRQRHGWSARELGEQMTRAGVPWNQAIVANFESGRRPYVTVEELFALCVVLSVAPVHVLAPLASTSADYAITPTLNPTTPGTVRAWIRGQRTVGAQDPRVFFTELPGDEFKSLLPPGLDEASKPLNEEGEPHE